MEGPASVRLGRALHGKEQPCRTCGRWWWVVGACGYGGCGGNGHERYLDDDVSRTATLRRLAYRLPVQLDIDSPGSQRHRLVPGPGAQLIPAIGPGRERTILPNCGWVKL